MHPPQTTLSARRAFLEELIDDAGLFPPAALGMREALAEDDRARALPEAWMLRRFVVPAARVDELIGLRPAALPPLSLSAIVDGLHVARDVEHVLRCAESSRGSVGIGAIELRLPEGADGDVASSVMRIVADIDASGLHRSTPVYLEFAFTSAWRTHVTATFDAFADAAARSAHPVAAKIRCGGAPPAGAPRPEQLGFAVGTLRALGVPFKATAGLHHPVRGNHGASGAGAHGFLNVMGVAVLDYELDLDERTRARILLEEKASAFTLDEEAFGWNGMRVDAAQIAAARRDFVHGFGSCSFAEPVQDLRALGVLT